MCVKISLDISYLYQTAQNHVSIRVYSMPIYEYTCLECQSTIEIFQPNTQFAPARCGFRCSLPAYDTREIRGFGTLKRKISTFSGHMGTKLNDKPTVEEMQRSGFAVYENQGGGVIKKRSGVGPNVIRTQDLPDTK